MPLLLCCWSAGGCCGGGQNGVGMLLVAVLLGTHEVISGPWRIVYDVRVSHCMEGIVYLLCVIYNHHPVLCDMQEEGCQGMCAYLLWRRCIMGVWGLVFFGKALEQVSLFGSSSAKK